MISGIPCIILQSNRFPNISDSTAKGMDRMIQNSGEKYSESEYVQQNAQKPKRKYFIVYTFHCSVSLQFEERKIHTKKTQNHVQRTDFLSLSLVAVNYGFSLNYILSMNCTRARCASKFLFYTFQMIGSSVSKSAISKFMNVCMCEIILKIESRK